MIARLIFRVLLALGGGVALRVAAATYYLDPVAGRMSNAGSADAPWSTLEAVMDSRPTWQAGDVLLLRTGDHGRPAIRGAIDGGEVTIRAQDGHTPRVASLAFKTATHWNVSGLQITPEGAPAAARKSGALVTIAGDCSDIVVRACEIFSVRDISRWSEADWLAQAVTGIISDGRHCTIEGNALRNVRFGITVGRGGTGSVVARNTIDNFMSDGLRGLADDCRFESNIVRNCFRIDDNHDDGFQSWSGGAGGVPVGGGVVKGVVLRGNIFISYTDPAQPFKAAMQGIGCFDGMFEDWVVENNVVVTDMWHGIAFYGAKHCRIVNNTVVKNPIDAAARTPWIQISPHKKGAGSTGNLVRNNLTPTLHVPAATATADHNLVTSDYAAQFVDYAHFDFHLRAGSAAIDAGADEVAPRLDLDARPRTSPVDIGAYEAAGGTQATPRR